MNKKTPFYEKKTLKVSLLERNYLGIVVAQWHKPYTEALFKGATRALEAHQIPHTSIWRRNVPGCFEIPLATAQLLQRKDIAGIVAIGCLLRGKTPHFDYLAKALTKALTKLILKHQKPIGWGILLADNEPQIKARAANNQQNKGHEATLAVLHMLAHQGDQSPPKASLSS